MFNIGLEFSRGSSAGHKFIQTTGKPLTGKITEASVLIANQFLRQNLSAKKWRKENRTWTIGHEFPPGTRKNSQPINYLIIAEHIRTRGEFNGIELGLPELGSMWLDHATEMKLDFHISQGNQTLKIESGDLQTHYYGKAYPIRPSLRREGRLYTSFQPQLIRRIIKKRLQLIDESEKALTDDWIFDLRALISDTISVVDIAFTQLYIKAEYDPLPGWKFDKEKLGERHGRRLNDKFKWIYQITGKAINIESEKDSLNVLKDLRNHLMHFDPPSLVVTLEEATLWLNKIIDIGCILVKIRQAIGVDISEDIINFLLQKEAIFVPATSGKRTPLNDKKTDDYYSSIWPQQKLR